MPNGPRTMTDAERRLSLIDELARVQSARRKVKEALAEWRVQNRRSFDLETTTLYLALHDQLKPAEIQLVEREQAVLRELHRDRAYTGKRN